VGVRDVSNLIEVEPGVAEVDAIDIEERIHETLGRMADVDASAISVTKSDDVVRLEGSVGSLAERRIVQRVAESAPGVTRVENQVVIN
jgi:osmotically-inducible protein OsmY